MKQNQIIVDDLDDLEEDLQEGNSGNYGQLNNRGSMVPDRLGHILDVDEDDEILSAQ